MGRLSSWAGIFVTVLLLSLATASGQQAPPGYTPFTMDQLEQLVAPIALYPDALLAQVLAASTYPNDVIAAAQWEDSGGNPQDASSQPWDSSVQGIARFPTVLHYMAGNADWMNNLGAAFINQQTDVMQAVQMLRAQALAAGTLVSTPQQTVINENGFIQIIPTNPNQIFVPIYDPNAVFGAPSPELGELYSPPVTFGPPLDVGDWLDFDLNWSDGGIYFGQWGPNRPWWHQRPGQGYTGPRNGQTWHRNNQKPPPRMTPGRLGPPQPVRAQPYRGYDQEQPANNGEMPGYGWGGQVNREEERGRQSRGAQPQPAPRQEPQRSAPPPPPPQQQRAEPGGAFGGYSPGGQASQDQSRGADSRGGGGGRRR